MCAKVCMECFDVDIDHAETTPTRPSSGQSLWETLILYIHCKNKIVKITNSFVSTVARNNGNCN